ncbi:MAG: LutB/LldF family L-lactate oxidation iron-sulfur protein [Proteobacteria bacterium]|nr:LutB/LldF family L-lactate oxidation iron-sulfur protein [Pseudomonadota bacterium]
MSGASTEAPFGERIDRALADTGLQRALGGTVGRLATARRDAFAALPEGDALRDAARAAKLGALASLDRHLEALARAVEANGGHVHWARDAAQARTIVIDIAHRAGAQTVVKSKSMATEEIALNPALEAAGLRVVETDLGEYIVQQAGEAPSHIIVPAIHKTRADVTDLFERVHGTDRKETAEALTAEARARLRQDFLGAEMGITGANFAIAATGSLVIVENEGNARLCSTLPRVHVAVMGMEKVVPDWPTVGTLLSLLARSATGQRMTSYVSVLGGPRGDDEVDGPEEFHLVLLDNGRSELLADPVLRESLACIRCGACLNACPVYGRIGGHAYGFAVPGPIGAVVAPTIQGTPDAAALPFASSLCGACRDVCPVRIDLPRMLLAQRARARRGDVSGLGRAERGLARMAARVLGSERRYRVATALLRGLTRGLSRFGPAQRLPGVAAWTGPRTLPEPAKEPFRRRWERDRG